MGYLRDFLQYFSKIFFEDYVDKVKFNSSGEKGEIILIGDSHADTLSHELNIGEKNNYSLKRFHTHMLLPEMHEYDLIMKSIDKNFYKKNKNIINYLNQSKGSTVVIYNYYSLRILEKDANNKQYRKILVGEPSFNNKIQILRTVLIE